MRGGLLGTRTVRVLVKRCVCLVPTCPRSSPARLQGGSCHPQPQGTRHQSEIKMGFLEAAAPPGSVTRRESICGLLSRHLTPGLSTGMNSGLFSHPPVPCLCSLWSPSWHLLLLWGPAVLATPPSALPQTFLLPFSCTPLLPPAVLHSVPCSQVLHGTHQTPPLAPATLGAFTPWLWLQRSAAHQLPHPRCKAQGASGRLRAGSG